ncbi:F-box only protein 48 [Trichoplax sp. H2]|uniref:F-box domain-containing protein n=1 Tax=Trichoplax adhaerens TaxID=10228 RepID=B3RQL3_TRIAD|nr:hypothetical protein TRIADDRAFT_55029 [Trichoplax adhaerens]EDV27269.1 hypothetical protein TRIADDRAFT_55029 [Trichoplax adhaerens]RDD42582.1 F-box only protein 48 [Trichoplax sp. H2]|eukprot:XP_002111265.1 hypothetical protein TRIADDRAFT_55029 [Trichoplax adhaerens]
MDFVNLLPAEISVMIFGLANYNDLSQALQTCTTWHDFINHTDYIWKQLCDVSILDDEQGQQSLKQLAKMNYYKKLTLNFWLSGKMSQVCSIDQLPTFPTRPFDVDTWGRILEMELTR